MDNLLKIGQIPFDIRAEVLMRMLADHYDMGVEQMLMRPTQFFQRWGRRDVLALEEGFSAKLKKDVLQIDVCREGLFDTLPESIFFHPDDKYIDYATRVKKLSEQEAYARKFFLPFEQLFGWLRLENEISENAVENNIESWWQSLIIGEQSFADETLSSDQQGILMQLQPFLPDILGNWALTAEWLSLFLNTEITINETAPPVYNLPEILQKRLGEGILGQDFVIGTIFTDGIPVVNICFEQPAPDDIAGYLPGGDNRKLLDEVLLPYLLPVEIPYAVEVKVPEGIIKIFKIGDNDNNSIVGYTTYLT